MIAVNLSNQRAVALVIFVLALLGWAIYVILENRRTTSEIAESFYGAPNRKAPPEDEVFEGPRLDRWLGWALVMMTLVALSLPVYWLGEPARQVGAIKGFDKRSVHRGEELFGKGEHGFGCSDCHGADGGGGVVKTLVKQYNEDGSTKMDSNGKPVLNRVEWVAPRVNDIGLRYRPEQIRNVLIYGRGAAKNNPMPAWGVKGGGPGDPQQINDLVNYLMHTSIEGNEEAEEVYNAEYKATKSALKAYEKAFVAAGEAARERSEQQYEEVRAAAEAVVANEAQTLAAAKAKLEAAKAEAATKPLAFATAQTELAAAEKLIANAKKTVAASAGEVLFDLHCARCHTNGASYGDPQEAGGGYYGPSLRESSLRRQFPDKAAQADFIKNGAANDEAYGTGGVNDWSGGGMPYFSNILTDEQIEAIVDYERSLK